MTLLPLPTKSLILISIPLSAFEPQNRSTARAIARFRRPYILKLSIILYNPFFISGFKEVRSLGEF